MSIISEQGAGDQESQAGCWRYYTALEGEQAKCTYCDKIIKTSKGNTTGLLRHLKSIHNIAIAKKRKMRETPSDHQIQTESLEKVISRMAALDGIPFSKFVTSEDIRRGLVAQGFKHIDRSPNSIREAVFRYYEEVKKVSCVGLVSYNCHINIYIFFYRK